MFRSGTADNDGWYGCDVIRAPTSIRLGNKSNKGWARSPVIALTNDDATAEITVTFYASKVDVGANGMVVSVLNADGTVLDSQTLSDLVFISATSDINAETNFRSVTFSDVPTGFLLQFDAAQSNANISLDTITVLQTVPDPPVEPPVFTAPESVTIRAGSEDSFTITALTAEGKNSYVSLESISPVFTTSSLFSFDGYRFTCTPAAEDIGEHTVTFATTVGTEIFTHTVSITVISADAPLFTAPATVEIAAGTESSFTITATNPDESSNYVSLESISPAFSSASGFSFNGSRFTCTPSTEDLGEFTITFRSDIDTMSYYHTVTVIVTSENAPVFTAPELVTIPAGTEDSFTITAKNPDGTDAYVSLRSISPEFSATGGFFFDGSRFTCTPTSEDLGDHTVTFYVTVGTETFIKTVTIRVTSGPAPTFTAPERVEIPAGTEGSFTISATNPDATQANISLGDITPPFYMATVSAFDGYTFTCTPVLEDVGEHTVSFWTDYNNERFTNTVTVAVTSDPPVFTAPQAVTLEAGLTGSFKISAATPAGFSTYVTLQSVSPAFSAGSDAVFDGSTFTWTPSAEDIGEYTFTFLATVGSESYFHTVPVTVIAGEPVFTAPASAVFAPDVENAFTVSAVRSDGSACTVTFASVTPAPPSTQPVFDGTTLTWTPTEADVGTYTLVFETVVSGTTWQQSIPVSVEIPILTETIFSETFSGSDLSSRAMESSELVSPSRSEPGEFLSDTADYAGWTGQAVYRSHYSIRLGNASYRGWAQSPTITFTNGVATADITVTLYACKTRDAANAVTVSILDATGATLQSQTLTSLAPADSAADITAEGNFKTLSFTDVPTGFMLRFDPAQPDGAVVLDTITVLQVLEEVSENAPTFTAPASVTIPAGTEGSFTIAATKTDGTSASVSLQEISPALSTGSTASFDGYTFTMKPALQDAGVFTVTFKAAVGAETFTHSVCVVVTLDDLTAVVPAISDIGFNHFRLDWSDAQLRSAGYGLRIWYGADDCTATGVDTCTFVNGEIPLLWEASGLSAYSDGSLQFNTTGDSLTTALYPKPVTQLTYNINKERVSDGTTGTQFDVYATADDSETPEWVNVESLTGAASIANGDHVLTFDAALGYRRFRFVYTNKASGNIRMRSVDAVYDGAGARFTVGSATETLRLDKTETAYVVEKAHADRLYFVEFVTYDSVEDASLSSIQTLRTVEAPSMTLFIVQ